MLNFIAHYRIQRAKNYEIILILRFESEVLNFGRFLHYRPIHRASGVNALFEPHHCRAESRNPMFKAHDGKDFLGASRHYENFQDVLIPHDHEQVACVSNWAKRFLAYMQESQFSLGLIPDDFVTCASIEVATGMVPVDFECNSGIVFKPNYLREHIFELAKRKIDSCLVAGRI